MRMTSINSTSFVGVGSRWEVFRFNDPLHGTGPFTVDAGLGDDLVIAQVKADLLIGGGGADVLIADAGDDVLYGDAAGSEGPSDGDDRLFGEAGRDTMVGGGGADLLAGGDDEDMLLGGSGHDGVYGGGGVDILIGGSGNDVLRGGSLTPGPFYAQYAWDGMTDVYIGPRRIGGGETPVTETFDPAPVIDDRTTDWLYGEEGDDTASGEGGNDVLFSGEGNDLLIGGAGSDWLDGGTGMDTAAYSDSPAAVTLFLNHGFGLGGDAAGDGLAGIENLRGSNWSDWIVGDAGNNVIEGLIGMDWLFGHDGNDVIRGGRDNSAIADPNPHLYDQSSDQILGGTGSDTLYGDSGNDQFWFLAADFEPGVYDYIMDFSRNSGGPSVKMIPNPANYDFLRFEGIPGQYLTFTNHGGYCLVSTVSLGGNGGVVIFDMTTDFLVGHIVMA